MNIDISQTAVEHFSALIEQQGGDVIGLRLDVASPGTPAAQCEMSFCEPSDCQADDLTFPLGDYQLFVVAGVATFLDGASIDFVRDAMGGQLTIRAPGLRGSAPDEDAPIEERVRYWLEADINPMLAQHGGRVSLEAITRQLEVVLRFGGGCHGCGMVDVTLKQGIETTLKEKVPEITAVVDATDHSTGENPYYEAQA
jgi:Fe/S biogenesis protein NfuA